MRIRTVGTDPFALFVVVTTLGLSACGPDDDAVTAGAIPRYVLNAPEVVSGEFGSVNGIRVRGDGSLLVADPISGELVLADLDAGTREIVGSRGEGPGEYQSLSGVWPLPGDSTLLVDFANNRLTVLAPDLSFGATQPVMERDPEGGIRLLRPQAIDEAARVYIVAGSSGSSADSMAVLQIALVDLSTDTVARLTPAASTSLERGGGSDNVLRLRRTPYPASDSWGVAPDGSVVVARASDYHLDWIGTNGSVTGGTAVAHDPVPVGQAEREEWVERNTSTMRVSGSDDVIVQGGGEVDDYDWPETLPAFIGRILIDPEGRAWLRCQQPVGAPWLYDIFTPDAEHAGTVEVANGNTVVGFGDGVVYVTSKDEVDLVYIERHRLPGR